MYIFLISTFYIELNLIYKTIFNSMYKIYILKLIDCFLYMFHYVLHFKITKKKSQNFITIYRHLIICFCKNYFQIEINSVSR